MAALVALYAEAEPTKALQVAAAYCIRAKNNRAVQADCQSMQRLVLSTLHILAEQTEESPPGYTVSKRVSRVTDSK